MFILLVTFDSLGLQTTMGVVERAIKAHFAEEIEIAKLVVPEQVTFQSAIVNDELISISKPIDVVIFFERTVDHSRLWAARHRILVPNPEWLTPQVTKSVARLTEMWHKTYVSLRTLAGCFPSLTHAYIGMCSRDFSGGDPDFNRFIHFKGSSSQKQTEVVLAAWRKHPEWPELSVQSYVRHIGFLHFPEWLQWRNIRIKYCRMTAEEYRAEAMRGGVHLCPSSTEGFGHYLDEARSIGALIVTTDAAPMNELVDHTCGVLVAPAHTEKQNFAMRHIIELRSFEMAIEKVLKMPLEERKELGAVARRRYVRDRERFQVRLLGEIRRLA